MGRGTLAERAPLPVATAPMGTGRSLLTIGQTRVTPASMTPLALWVHDPEPFDHAAYVERTQAGWECRSCLSSGCHHAASLARAFDRAAEQRVRAALDLPLEATPISTSKRFMAKGTREEVPGAHFVQIDGHSWRIDPLTQRTFAVQRRLPAGDDDGTTGFECLVERGDTGLRCHVIGGEAGWLASPEDESTWAAEHCPAVGVLRAGLAATDEMSRPLVEIALDRKHASRVEWHPDDLGLGGLEATIVRKLKVTSFLAIHARLTRAPRGTSGELRMAIEGTRIAEVHPLRIRGDRARCTDAAHGSDGGGCFVDRLSGARWTEALRALRERAG